MFFSSVLDRLSKFSHQAFFFSKNSTMLKIYSHIIWPDIISIITKLKKMNFYQRFQNKRKVWKIFCMFQKYFSIFWALSEKKDEDDPNRASRKRFDEWNLIFKSYWNNSFFRVISQYKLKKIKILIILFISIE